MRYKSQAWSFSTVLFSTNSLRDLMLSRKFLLLEARRITTIVILLCRALLKLSLRGLRINWLISSRHSRLKSHSHSWYLPGPEAGIPYLLNWDPQGRKEWKLHEWIQGEQKCKVALQGGTLMSKVALPYASHLLASWIQDQSFCQDFLPFKAKKLHCITECHAWRLVILLSAEFSHAAPKSVK